MLARFRCLPHTLKSSTVYNGGNEHGWTSGRCSICTPLCNPSPTDWGVNAASCASTILLKGRILHNHVPVNYFSIHQAQKVVGVGMSRQSGCAGAPDARQSTAPRDTCTVCVCVWAGFWDLDSFAGAEGPWGYWRNKPQTSRRRSRDTADEYRHFK